MLRGAERCSEYGSEAAWLNLGLKRMSYFMVSLAPASAVP